MPKLVEEKNRLDLYGFQELNNRSLSVHTQATKGEGACTPIQLSLPTDACRVSRVRSRTLGWFGFANDLEI